MTQNTALHDLPRGLDMLYPLLKVAGADVTIRNARGESPLHRAVRSGDENLMRLLLLDACDPDPLDVDGNAPLHVAARQGDSQLRRALVRSLVKSGADLDKLNACGQCALDIAREQEEPGEIVVWFFGLFFIFVLSSLPRGTVVRKETLSTAAGMTSSAKK